MAEGDREDPVASLERRHPVDETTRRLLRGSPHVDHAAVVVRHHRPHFAPRRAQTQTIDVGGALRHVYVRIFFVGDEHVSVRTHPLG